MFKITITAEDLAELRSKLVDTLSGMDEFTKESVPSQVVAEVAHDVKEALEEHARATSVPPPVFPPILAQELPPPPIAPLPAPIKTYQEKVGTLLEFGVDSKGLPWDSRIHSVSQGTNKDGSWRLRRGVEDAQVTQVEFELRQRLAAEGHAAPPVTPPSLPPIPPPAAPPAPFLAPPQPVVLQAVPPAPVQQPIAPPPAPAIAAPSSIAPVLNAHTAKTFKENLVATLGRLVSEGKLTQDYVNQLKAYFQVDQIWQVSEAQAAEMFETFVANKLIVKAE